MSMRRKFIHVLREHGSSQPRKRKRRKVSVIKMCLIMRLKIMSDLSKAGYEAGFRVAAAQKEKAKDSQDKVGL